MRLVLLIDLPADHKYHRASVVALEHAVAAEKLSASVVAIRTDELTGDIDQLGSGVVIGPGSPYNNPSAANAAIEQARKTGIPLVGT